ncbi:hypothetical protein [Oceanospirillum linum]|uniref:Uncharacterized protein n=1 Tax=Oceanospirillum linum TaxID=966 RepID=A0A1T1H7W3_OCELI|nr:hypothetical protein [Oceanospirillum linum]OOV85933.1 hypothetical protein BTA35_0215580 [Oceanospirillum linum]SEG45673.1 hypothetical protein SAMN04489856_111102 [Oleiphilus messinensis]SMP34632.1 hypothetical protein SAMN06264348_111101 [Oceanospirillum linum]
MADSSKARELRFKRLLGIVLLSELMSGKRNLLNAMLDKGTMMEKDRKELELPPLPHNAWQGLPLKQQLRKARLESAILALAEDRTVNPKKKLVYQDHIYAPSQSSANGRDS